MTRLLRAWWPWALLVASILVTGAAVLWPADVHTAPVPESTFDVADEDTYDGTFVMPDASIDGARVVAPTIGMEVALVDVGGNGESLQVPPAPQVGRYDESAELGADRGATVVAGHVDRPDRSLTPFGSLHEIAKGAPVFVVDADGTEYAYRVVEMNLYDQDGLPPELFTRAGDPVLHLVTCAGESVDGGEGSSWDYEYNLVVTAVPVTP